jgi:hypothetical protein
MTFREGKRPATIRRQSVGYGAAQVNQLDGTSQAVSDSLNPNV